MDKLTLDTNVLRDWAWSEGRVAEKRYGDDQVARAKFQSLFRKIQDLRDNGVCELGVTSKIYADFHQTGGKLPAHIAEMIGQHVTIATPGIFGFPLSIPFVFIDTDEFERLFQDLFPSLRPDNRKYRSSRIDALQLFAHKVAKRDFFITNDQTIFSERRVVMEKKWGIRVMSLEEYVSMRDPTVTSVT